MMVCQPTDVVELEKALLTLVATMAPARRKNCRETTTKPRNGAGTISAWYVLEGFGERENKRRTIKGHGRQDKRTYVIETSTRPMEMYTKMRPTMNCP